MNSAEQNQDVRELLFFTDFCQNDFIKCLQQISTKSHRRHCLCSLMFEPLKLCHFLEDDGVSQLN